MQTDIANCSGVTPLKRSSKSWPGFGSSESALAIGCDSASAVSGRPVASSSWPHSTTALNGGSVACERMRTCSCACVPLASLLMWLSETLSSPMPLCKRAALRAAGSR
ncbi:hypothetical protein BA187_15465 [Serratia marcescens]|nr:hypothetical protein BA187_15465 [Serratia marcescens]